MRAIYCFAWGESARLWAIAVRGIVTTGTKSILLHAWVCWCCHNSCAGIFHLLMNLRRVVVGLVGRDDACYKEYSDITSSDSAGSVSGESDVDGLVGSGHALVLHRVWDIVTQEHCADRGCFPLICLSRRGTIISTDVRSKCPRITIMKSCLPIMS